MAQRYGRRRRRAHREQIEQQERIILGMQRMLRDVRNEEVRIEQKLVRFERMMDYWDNDVRTMLGPYSAFLFETAEIATRGNPTHIEQLPLPPRLNPVFMLSELPEYAIAMRVAYLKHCISTIIHDEKNCGELQSLIRLTITGEGSSVATFSQNYWENIGGASERDINHLALKIAADMFEKIKKNGPSARRRA